MPLKGLKNFTRRRSAGNELDASEEKTPAGSSFRVLPRSDNNDYPSNRSTAGSRPNSSPNELWGNGYYDQGNRLTNRSADTAPSRSHDNLQEVFRTNNSSSTEASSIDRLSYASTQPSSIDSHSQDDLSNHFQKRSYPNSRQASTPQEQERPRPKHRFSIADATRTFSFGRPKPQKANSSPPRKDDGASVTGRERSTTASSYASSYGTQSTAHPPKVDMGYEPESPQTEAGASWLSGVGGRHLPIVDGPWEMQPPLPPPPAVQRQGSESPSYFNQKKQFSWEEDDERPPMPLSNRLENSPRPDHASSRRSWESNASETAFLSRGSYRSPPPPRQGLGLKTASSPTMPPPDSPTQAESPGFDAPDNQGLLDAISAGAALDEEYAPKPAMHLPDRSRPGASPPQNSRQVPFRSMHTSHSPYDDDESRNVTPKPHSAQPHHHDSNAPMFENTRRNTMNALNERSSVIPRNTKIMTKAEFESLKQSSAGRDEDAESQKSEESEVDEDEDEIERAKQLAKQRRKQEAHLAVYRQQMMKVTGEQPGDLPSLSSGRPTVSRSTQSLPSLNNVQIPTLDPSITQAETPTKSSDEEDDDVPLGVLQAHGFPSRSRPPTRMTSASTSAVPRPLSQMSTYPIPQGATRNDPMAGGGGNTDLPAFARHLPRDPYVGANLVNQSTRQSLGQNYQAASGSSLPPGGLVGVIAGEERAKAMRRGSPNVNGTYGHVGSQQMPGPQMPHPGMLSSGMGMPFMPMQHQSYGDQAQMQTNQQLQQMMQMQMQWMQQMQQMMQMQGMQTPQLQAQGGASEPFWSQQGGEGGMHQNRESMMSTPSMTNDYQAYHQRSPSAMSLMPPTSANRPASFMGGYNPNNLSASSTVAGHGGYAPSIAPSERSNVGQPSRYRPVTNNAGGSQAHNSRTNTMSGAMGNELNVAKSRSRSPHKLDLPTGPGQGFGAVNNNPSTIRAVNKPKKGSGGGGSDDEEDNAAWAEMRKRREERRSRWMARKQEKEDAETPFKKEGMEGLYYEG